MKAIVATTASRGELQLADFNAPDARGRELRVEVHASSLNPHDWKYHQWFQRNLYRWPLPLPALRLGHDFAGTVTATGPKVRSFQPGDAVYGMTAKTGAFAECITIDERMVAHAPSAISVTEAAALPMVGLTALQALRRGRLGPDSAVLIIGGSGGVGSVAVQIAKARGARVTAVCSTRNVDFVRGLGADTVIDYRTEDFTQCGESFDIVFDTIGHESTTTCRGLLKPGACFISTNTSAGKALAAVLTPAMARLKPDTVRSGTLLALPRGRDLQELRDMVEAGALRVPIDREFPLAAMRDAIAYSQTGRARGKIAIAVRQKPD